MTITNRKQIPPRAGMSHNMPIFHGGAFSLGAGQPILIGHFFFERRVLIFSSPGYLFYLTQDFFFPSLIHKPPNIIMSDANSQSKVPRDSRPPKRLAALKSFAQVLKADNKADPKADADDENDPDYEVGSGADSEVDDKDEYRENNGTDEDELFEASASAPLPFTSNFRTQYPMESGN
jgi:hypothetical protein